MEMQRLAFMSELFARIVGYGGALIRFAEIGYAQDQRPNGLGMRIVVRARSCGRRAGPDSGLCY